MGVGLIILHGESEEQIGEDILQHLIEVRVEQGLSKATKFAIRFSEDFCRDTLEIGSVAKLNINTVISILVPAENGEGDYVCLVKGPITEIKTSIVTGGQGSWYECHGLDMRHLLDRAKYKRSWVGVTSDLVVALVKQAGFTCKAPIKTRITYQASEGNKKSLTQSGTDLEFISAQARRNSYEFWLTYSTSRGAPPQAALKVTPTFHFAPSPGPDASVTSDLSVGEAITLRVPTLDLGDEADARPLIINSPGHSCDVNVTKFSLDVDAKIASKIYISSLNPETRQVIGETTFTPRPQQTPRPTSPAGQAPVTYVTAETIAENSSPIDDTVSPTGTIEEQRLEALANLYEDSWFVSATCTTSLYRYGRPIIPHEMVEVKGAGPFHSGIYQVSDVTHVITPQQHLMDLTLRRNTMGLSKEQLTFDADSFPTVLEPLGAVA